MTITMIHSVQVYLQCNIMTINDELVNDESIKSVAINVRMSIFNMENIIIK